MSESTNYSHRPIVVGIIPSRYASTRFPGKPLAMLGNKPMIQHVYERAQLAGVLDELLVATDDERIENVVKAFGGRAMRTAATHQNGTERCAEVAQRLDNLPPDAIILNIQGDEPFVHPDQLHALTILMQQGISPIGTLAKRITDAEQLVSPNVVKVVFNRHRQALYFSRYPIPYHRAAPLTPLETTTHYFKHLGLYAYRKDALLQLAALAPSALEIAESLEQLRWLDNGFGIGVAITEHETVGIDTPQDLVYANQLLAHIGLVVRS